MSRAPHEQDDGPGSGHALSGVRVLDFTTGVAGAYCTKLLADAGADVVRVERDGSGRRGPMGGPGLSEYLATSKRSVGEAQGDRLVGAADIVVAGADFDVEAARAESPGLVVVTVSAFGRSGPWADRPGTEFTMQADCGSIGGRGLPGEAPLSAGGRLGEWLAALYSAITALALWMRATRDGAGDHADVAILDCMAVGMVTFPSVFAEFARSAGRPPMGAATRRIEVPSIEPTLDGFVNFTTNSAQQFADFAALIGHPEMTGDERFARPLARFEHREEFWALTRAYTSARTTAQVLEEAGLLRIPVAPVLDAASIPSFEQFVVRQVLVDHPSGRFRQPRIPYRLHGRPTPPFGRVAEPGQHDGAVTWAPRPARSAPPEGRLPLDGVRVIDLTSWWAGPCGTQVLGFLGADVIKVESTVRPDLMRYSSVRSPGEGQWWEWGPLAHAVNTNKRGVTIDLTRPEGRELALDLAASADVVVENYTPRVLAQFGLEWKELHAVNPRLNLVRMPAFGLDGPWRDRPGFAQTMESLTGLAAGTGWPDGYPVLVGGAGDPVAGLHASFATLVALVATPERRARPPGGVHHGGGGPQRRRRAADRQPADRRRAGAHREPEHHRFGPPRRLPVCRRRLGGPRGGGRRPVAAAVLGARDASRPPPR